MPSSQSNHQKRNQQEDLFHQLMNKAPAWIAFIKFYFYDPKSADLKVSEGTGFLNSKWTIITAAHNLYLVPENIKCNHCVIYLRDPSKDSRQIKIKSRPPSQWFQNGVLDIALIRLEQEVKHFKGRVYFGDIADFKSEKLPLLYVSGFSTKMNELNDNSNGMKMHKVRSSFDQFVENQIKYSAKTQKGLSGSPIIYRCQDKAEPILKIIGMHLMRKYYRDDCKGLFFNENTINLLQCWMNKLELEKKKIQNRLSMMMRYFTKIFESIKRQLLQNDQNDSHNYSEWFRQNIRQNGQQYNLQNNQKIDEQRLKALKRQQDIRKNQGQLINYMIYDEPEGEIFSKIHEIYKLQREQQIVHIPSDKPIVAQKPKKQQKYQIMPQQCKLSFFAMFDSQKLPSVQKPLNIVAIQEQCLGDSQKRQKTILDNSCARQAMLKQIQKIKRQSQHKSQNQRGSISLDRSQSTFNLYEQCNSGDSAIMTNPASNLNIQNKNSEFLAHQKTPYSDILNKSMLIQVQQDKPINNDKIKNKIQIQTEINYPEIIQFPYNCIGWITSINELGDQFTLGSGFLISPNLVLTSADNFCRYRNSEVQQLIYYNSTIIGDENKDSACKQIKIQNYRTHQQFINIRQNIIPDERQKEDLLKGNERQLRYSYSLLQLEEPVLRAQYFEVLCDYDICSGINQQLTICGYTKIENRFYQICQKTRIQIPIKTSEECIYITIKHNVTKCGSPVFIRNKGVIKLVGIHV